MSTDPEYPVFLSAKVKSGTRHDSPELIPLLKAINRKIKLGNVVLDSGYLSRKNVDLIKMDGGTPIIKGKKNLKSRSKGSMAWKEMITFQRKNGEEFKEHYGRRNVIEGVFRAFKRRFTEVVRSKMMHNRKIEVLSGVVVWNTISWAYNCPE
jgi:transposase